MIPPEWIELVTKGGIIGVCLLTIWLGTRREDRQSTAFENLNKQQHETHIEIIKQLSELNVNTRTTFDEIKSRPCVNDDWDGHERRRRERDKHP